MVETLRARGLVTRTLASAAAAGLAFLITTPAFSAVFRAEFPQLSTAARTVVAMVKPVAGSSPACAPAV